MLFAFLQQNRTELIDRCRAKVAGRTSGFPKSELEHGVTVFLEQLIDTLRLEHSVDASASLRVSGPKGGIRGLSEMSDAATLHAQELARHGYQIDEVVHDYGDLCQAITDLAAETSVRIEVDEFRTLNRCMDNVIAAAVTEFARERAASQMLDDCNERLGMLTHELRNHLTTATLAFALIQGGGVGTNGATGMVLGRALSGLRDLIDRSLAEVRMNAGLPLLTSLIPLPGFISEIQVSATLEADAAHCALSVGRVEEGLAITGDRALLMAAVGNLLQNAFKFTQPHTSVSLDAVAVGDRIHIEVRDCCGGLGENAQTLFLPFVQAGANRTGVGLGLSIVRRSVEANGGALKVRDLPGIGCVFTLDLPRANMAAAS